MKEIVDGSSRRGFHGECGAPQDRGFARFGLAPFDIDADGFHDGRLSLGKVGRPVVDHLFGKGELIIPHFGRKRTLRRWITMDGLRDALRLILRNQSMDQPL
jgi:hypothetical protein